MRLADRFEQLFILLPESLEAAVASQLLQHLPAKQGMSQMSVGMLRYLRMLMQVERG